MSQSYAINLTVSGHDPRRAKAIQAAAAAKWPFVEWSKTQGQMTSYAEGQLFGGQNERQFAAELTLAIWQANGAYCKVAVSTTYLEELPGTKQSLGEAEYADWRSGRAAEQPESASEKQEISQNSSAAVKLGPLRIDASLLAAQHRLLTEITALAREYKPYLPAVGDAELLEGLLELTEVIADAAEAAAKQGDQDGRCECELPGYFSSGVPGILARIENGRLVPGATVERCDLCQRYASDEAALAKLQELGYVEPQSSDG